MRVASKIGQSEGAVERRERVERASIADLYRSDLDRHLFAPGPGLILWAESPKTAGLRASWLGTAFALDAWAMWS